MAARAPPAILRHARATPRVSLRYPASLQCSGGKTYATVARDSPSSSGDPSSFRSRRTHDSLCQNHIPFAGLKHEARGPTVTTCSPSTRWLSAKPAVSGPASGSTESLNDDNDEWKEHDDDPSVEETTSVPESPVVDAAVGFRNPFDELEEGYTPGQAMGALMRKAGKKRAQVKQAEMSNLCLAARNNRLRDALLIRRALQHFRAKSEFQLNTRTATDAMQSLLRAGGLPRRGPHSSNQKIEKALAAAHAFMDETTGLYYAAPTPTLDSTLSLLLEGVREAALSLPESATESAPDDVDDDAASNTDKDGSAEKAQEVLRATGDIIGLLIRRGNRPEKNMRKRAARKYLRKVETDEGPSPTTTLPLAVQIALEVGGVEQAQTLVVGPFVRWARFKLPEDVVAMMRAAREANAQAQAQAPQAEAGKEKVAATEEGEGELSEKQGEEEETSSAHKSEDDADDATEEETTSK